MSITLHTESPPLRQDASGALRIGDSRVPLELVIRAFQDGVTPEAIMQRYPATSLSDVYSVIGYYLRHSEEMETYLVERERLASEVRQRSEGRRDNLSEQEGNVDALMPFFGAWSMTAEERKTIEQMIEDERIMEDERD